PDPDDITIAQLPGLHRVAVDGRAVGRAEVGQRRGVTIPADLQVAPRHTGVRQAERRVLPAPDDVRALGEVVRAARPVVQLQRGRQLLLVAAVAALLAAVALVVPAVVALLVLLRVAALLAVALVVPARGVALLLAAVTALLAVALRLAAVALVVAAALGAAVAARLAAVAVVVGTRLAAVAAGLRAAVAAAGLGAGTRTAPVPLGGAAALCSPGSPRRAGRRTPSGRRSPGRSRHPGGRRSRPAGSRPVGRSPAGRARPGRNPPGAGRTPAERTSAAARIRGRHGRIRTARSPRGGPVAGSWVLLLRRVLGWRPGGKRRGPRSSGCGTVPCAAHRSAPGRLRPRRRCPIPGRRVAR